MPRGLDGGLFPAVPEPRYRDLGSNYQSRRNNQRRQRDLIRHLEHLTGQKGTLDPSYWISFKPRITRPSRSNGWIGLPSFRA
jgi:hypothetical protein